MLDIGCGPGEDSAALSNAGHTVIAFDLSPASLLRTRTAAPFASVQRADVRAALPFRDGTFDGAVASLSLHYFEWATTLHALQDIHRVLRPGSRFLFRVNANDDVNFGAGSGDELEPGLFRVAESTWGPPGAPLKRFFTEPMVRDALAERWIIEMLYHDTIERYDKPKRTWTCIARRP